MKLSKWFMSGERKQLANGQKVRVFYMHSFCDLDDLRIKRAFKRNMHRDNAVRKKLNAPTAHYDMTSKRAYLKYPDGRLEYVE